MSTNATPADSTAPSDQSEPAPEPPAQPRTAATASDQPESAPASAATTEPSSAEAAPTEPASSEPVGTTEGPTEEPAAAKPAAAKPKPMTLDDVTSVGIFLRFLAQHKATPKGYLLKKGSDARTLFGKPIDLDPYDDEIRSHAAEDLRLNTPVSLVLTMDRSDLTGGARQNFLALAARLITAHPAFRDDDIIDSLGRVIAADQTAQRQQTAQGQGYFRADHAGIER